MLKFNAGWEHFAGRCYLHYLATWLAVAAIYAVGQHMQTNESIVDVAGGAALVEKEMTIIGELQTEETHCQY